jgi:hypothetical protein
MLVRQFVKNVGQVHCEWGWARAVDCNRIPAFWAIDSEAITAYAGRQELNDTLDRYGSDCGVNGISTCL